MQATVDLEGVQVWQEAADGQVCGDLVFAVHGAGTARIMICDGCGHGQRARQMALTFCDIVAIDLHSPVGAEQWFAWNSALAERLPHGGFVTATLIELQDSGRHVRIWNAGNPRPIRTGGGDAPIEVDATGFPVGALLSHQYSPPVPTDIVLAENETLLVCSDGLGDQRRGEESFREAALARALRDHVRHDMDALLAHIHAAVIEFVDDGEMVDDLTVVAIRCAARANRPTTCPPLAAA